LVGTLRVIKPPTISNFFFAVITAPMDSEIAERGDSELGATDITDKTTTSFIFPFPP